MWGAWPRLVTVTLPPAATEASLGSKAKSTAPTSTSRGPADARAWVPAAAWPVTLTVPFMAAGWISQWNSKVLAWFRVTLAFLPAKRPPSAPGSMMPVPKEPSSAVRVCGLPPTFATSRVYRRPRSVRPGRSGACRREAGSTAWTRVVLGSSAPGSTVRTSFILAGLMRQK